MSSRNTVQRATTHAYTVNYACKEFFFIIISILTYCSTRKDLFSKGTPDKIVITFSSMIVRIEVYITQYKNEEKKGKRQSKGARLITFKSSKRRLQPLLMQHSRRRS